ncbi:MAG: hypothetical protein GY854_13300 [Deltaproteobacteria bacterium]|nr:hypothetical protein [Deltaproteobacteria bacterium]
MWRGGSALCGAEEARCVAQRDIRCYIISEEPAGPLAPWFLSLPGVRYEPAI